jgi:hypothetical protein
LLAPPETAVSEAAGREAAAALDGTSAEGGAVEREAAVCGIDGLAQATSRNTARKFVSRRKLPETTIESNAASVR